MTESEGVENHLVNEALKSLLLLLMIVIKTYLQTEVNTLVAFVEKQLCYKNNMGHIIPKS